MMKQLPSNRSRRSMTRTLWYGIVMSLLALLSGNSAMADDDTREVQATLYGDNFFDFFVNGKLVAKDTRLLPHTAFEATVRLQTDGENVLSAFLRDNAGEEKGLEWGDRCIDDGGFRLRLHDDSVVSNSDWKCRTVHYGPINPEQCYGLGLDWTGQRSAFGPGEETMTAELARPVNPIFACRDDRPVPVTDDLIGQNGFFYPEACQTLLLEWFADQTQLTQDGEIALGPDDVAVRADWAFPGYDDSFWDPAVEFSDLVVAWGVRPSTNSGPPWERTTPSNGETWGPRAALPNELVEFADPPGIRPSSVEVPEFLEWGASKFIWRPSLRFDNRIVCRLSIPDDDDSDSDSD